MARLCHAFCVQAAALHGRPRRRAWLPGISRLPSHCRHQLANVGTWVCLPSLQDEWPITSARFTPDRQPVILTQVQFRSRASAVCALQ